MRVLMPRCRKCVLCGDPIEGKGRIDRIYCSASCRTLAWRARAGHRWTGRRKTRASQPGDYVARSALPVLAVRMKAELDAAKRRIAELEGQASTRRGAAASTAVKAAAVTGAAGLTAAVLRHRAKRHRAELERVQAEAKAEQDRLRAEQAGEREQAARREAKLEQQVAELTSRCQSAEGHRRLVYSSPQTGDHPVTTSRADQREQTQPRRT